MEVTIEHVDGTTTVTDFTLIERRDLPLGETGTTITVWYGEPHDYGDDHERASERAVFFDATITEVRPAATAEV